MKGKAFLPFLASGIFLFYLATLSPTLFWFDSGEFLAAAWGLGVGHPAGSPLYLSLAKIMALLPLGPIAFRINLLSALTAAASVYLFCDLGLVFLSRFRGSETARRTLPIAAYLPGLLFGVSGPFWHEATITEVYGPQIFFLLLVLSLLICERPAHRRVALFLVGLGTGVHVTLLFYLPAVMYMALSGTDRGRRIKEGFLLSFCLVLGLSVYLYLPVRSSTGPYYNWGEPQTLERFLTHVTDRKDKEFHWALTPPDSSWRGKEYGLFLVGIFTLPLVILGVVGGGLLFRADRRFAVFLLLLFLPNVLFFIRYWRSPSAYHPSFVVFALWISYGLFILFSLGESLDTIPGIFRKGWFSASLVFVGMAAVAQVLFLDLSEKNLRAHRYSEEIYTTFFSLLKPNAIFFAQGYYFSMSYLQQVEGIRPDVALVFQSDVYRPRYFTPITQRRVPRLSIPDPGVNSHQDMPALISLNTDWPIYWEPDARTDGRMLDHLVPRGFFYELTTEPADVAAALPEHFARIRSVYDRAVDLAPVSGDYEYGTIFRYPLNDLGIHFLRLGMPEAALRMFELILVKYPGARVALGNIGQAYYNMGRYAEAEEHYLMMLKEAWDPTVPIALGRVYLSQSRFDRAEETFRTLLKRAAPSGEALFGLALAIEGQNRREEARQTYAQALPLLEQEGDQVLVEQAREKLKTLS